MRSGGKSDEMGGTGVPPYPPGASSSLVELELNAAEIGRLLREAVAVRTYLKDGSRDPSLTWLL